MQDRSPCLVQPTGFPSSNPGGSRNIVKTFWKTTLYCANCAEMFSFQLAKLAVVAHCFGLSLASNELFARQAVTSYSPAQTTACVNLAHSCFPTIACKFTSQSLAETVISFHERKLPSIVLTH